ncbi:MAG: cell division protein FtsL [Anaerolineae bacterium]|nr:cell division protein FtsL [Anaerolineae bacterium]
MVSSRDFPEHCQKTSERRFEARTVAIVALVLALLSLVGWLYLTQTSHLAVTGYRIMELEQRKALLEEENAQLEAEIAELESAARLMARAQALGFQRPEKVTYVIVPNYPVQEESRDEVSGVQRTAPTDSAEGLTSILARWWAGLVAQFDAWLQVQP